MSAQHTDFKDVVSIWQPGSWRFAPTSHQPEYDEEVRGELERVLAELQTMPPLVSVDEIEELRRHLREAALGQRFILQGGDCAERFQDCRPEVIAGKVRILQRMSFVLGSLMSKPIVQIGRIAGQYAKPRSLAKEIGTLLPVYRGDAVNGFESTLSARKAQPSRLLDAYRNSALTLNYIRAYLNSNEASLATLAQDENLGLGQDKLDHLFANLKQVANLLKSLEQPDVMKLGFRSLYTSHEGLILPYEQALTQYVISSGRYYNLGAHTLWVGERTRTLGHAHIEYFRGIGNPIGLKIGPSTNPLDLARLIDVLDPHGEPGRLMLVVRLGKDFTEEVLPPIIREVAATQRRVAWCVDPMHGNHLKTASGRKTRRFEDMLEETKLTILTLQDHREYLAGVHFEMTGELVTECLGGSIGITEADLSRQYESWCDPRLNGAQSLEFALKVGQLLERS